MFGCHSEIGYYGLTKEAALKKGVDAEEGAAPYAPVHPTPRAVTAPSSTATAPAHLTGTATDSVPHTGRATVTSDPPAAHALP